MASQAITTEEYYELQLEHVLLTDDAKPIDLPTSLVLRIDGSCENKIGSGGFSNVYKVEHQRYPFAVKKLVIRDNVDIDFLRELEFLLDLKLKHKNIVRFLAYYSHKHMRLENEYGQESLVETDKKMLLFEYVPNGTLAAYMKRCFPDSKEEEERCFPEGCSGDLKWTKLFEIIRGICQGLYYLHDKRICHLDLNPNNILLDENDVPKITDFGLSKFLDEKSCILTSKIYGTKGYVAPEFTKSTKSGKYEITLKLDLYSLGVIIMEMITGSKKCDSISDVLDFWSKKETGILLEQIRVCAQIGIDCSKEEPGNRPENMMSVVDRLVAAAQITEGGPCELLDIHPPLLRFQFEANKVATCPLELRNNTSEHVAFRIMYSSGEPTFAKLPLYGLVWPNTPYTLNVTTLETEEKPRERITHVIVDCATLEPGNDDHINTFESQPEKFFQGIGNAAKKVKLIAYCTPWQQHIATSSSKPISPTINVKRLTYERYPSAGSMDTDKDNKWIIKGKEEGYVDIWDYETKIKANWFKAPSSTVSCIKSIARKNCIVSGALEGYVYVYNYETRKHHQIYTACEVNALAVHPNEPYLLVAGKYMQLLNWNNRWKCERTFHIETGSEEVEHIEFGPKDHFATFSLTSESVTVWSIKSEKSIYTLSGHLGAVNCLDFFTYADREFLVTGSDDKTVKIWSLEDKKCVDTLETFVFPVTSVKYQPKSRTLITGSEDGAIYLWRISNSGISPHVATTCKKNTRKKIKCPRLATLSRIIKIGCVGPVYHLACDKKRVVIGIGNAIATMAIKNVNNSERHFSVATGQHAGDPASKEVTGSFSELLGVRPLELRIPDNPDEPIPCSLHLTNKTDDNVAFRLVERSLKSVWCFKKLPLYGIVPPRSTYTLIVTMKEEMKLEKKDDFDFVIESCILGDRFSMVFENRGQCNYVFNEARNAGHKVHEVTLEAVYVYGEGMTTKNISVMYNHDAISVDAHPTEPWILTGHYSGRAHVWRDEMKHRISSFQVSEEPVGSIMFFAKIQRIVAMVMEGQIHDRRKSLRVYKCASPTEIQEEEKENVVLWSEPKSQARMHMSARTVLLRSRALYKKTRIFEGAVLKTETLDPEANHVTAEYWDHEIRVCRDDPNEDFGPFGHLEKVNCLAWIRRGDKYDLITGSSDGKAKIWDLEEQKCIGTLEAMSPVLRVLVHPNFRDVITGTQHCIIQVWSSTDFRLKRTINLGGGGRVLGLACLANSQRLLVLQEKAIIILDIPDDEGTVASGDKDISELPQELWPQGGGVKFQRDWKMDF